MLKPGAGKILKQNAREMALTSHTGRTEGGPIWVGPKPSNQFLQVVRRQGLCCGKDIIEKSMQGDRRKIAQDVIRKGVDGTVRDVRVPVVSAERVDIGRGGAGATSDDFGGSAD